MSEEVNKPGRADQTGDAKGGFPRGDKDAMAAMGEGRFRSKRRRKVSFLTTNKVDKVDYKDVATLRRFLNDRGPGLHHVTFQVTSVDDATKELQEFGFEPFGGRSYQGYKEVFIHPRDTGGVLIQLYEGDWAD